MRIFFFAGKASEMSRFIQEERHYLKIATLDQVFWKIRFSFKGCYYTGITLLFPLSYQYKWGENQLCYFLITL